MADFLVIRQHIIYPFASPAKHREQSTLSFSTLSKTSLLVFKAWGFLRKLSKLCAAALRPY